LLRVREAEKASEDKKATKEIRYFSLSFHSL